MNELPRFERYKILYDTIPRDLKETRDIEVRHVKNSLGIDQEVVVSRVNLQKLSKLLDTYRSVGLNELAWKDQFRLLNPDMALDIAQNARVAIDVILNELAYQHLIPTTISNFGSVVLGEVYEGSDIDIKTEFSHVTPIDKASKWMQNVGVIAEGDSLRAHLKSAITPWRPVDLSLRMQGYNPGERAEYRLDRLVRLT